MAVGGADQPYLTSGLQSLSGHSKHGQIWVMGLGWSYVAAEVLWAEVSSPRDFLWF